VRQNTSIYFSILISIFICFLVIVILFYLGVPFNKKLISILFIIVIISVFILNFSFKYLINKSVKRILDEFYSKEYNLNKKKNFENINSLSKTVKKYASDKNLEIELLKEQENYRKDFIGNLSHELKTPLFTIQSYILTLIEGGYKDSEILTRYLKISSKAVDRLIYLVKDLDFITGLEAGINKVEYKSFNIIKLIKNVFELLEVESQENKISLIFDRIYSKAIPVYADEERILQVVTNLIMNSIKYGVNNGTTEVSVNQLNSEKLIIRITDNGLGISKKHLPRLFERFYRVDKSGNRKKGGSGLGLSIVKHIIEAHQEKIYVESTEGMGSEFSFTLQKA